MTEIAADLSSNSRRRLVGVFVMPLIVLALLFVGANLLGQRLTSRTTAAAARMSQRIGAAAKQQEIDWAPLAGLTPTEMQRPENVARVSQATERQWAANESAMQEFADLQPPFWLKILVPLGVVLCPLLALLLMLLALAIEIEARRLGGDLRTKGYSWLSHADTLWLILAVRREAGRLPPAADFELVPESRRTVDSLVAFVRRRREFRVR